MKRRALLSAIAATGGVTGATGCLQGSPKDSKQTPDEPMSTRPGSGTPTDTTDSQSDPSTSPTTEHAGDPEPQTEPDDARNTTADDPDWSEHGDLATDVSVGDRSTVVFPENNNPHAVQLWNRVDRERDVRIVYGDGRTEEAEVVGPHALPANGVFEVTLNVPTWYNLTVFVDDETFDTVVVGRQWFDCNASTSRYALAESELVDYGAISTMAGCPTPSVATTSFDVTSRDCGTESDDGAVLAYDGETIGVEGTFVSGSQCSQLSLADATYDARTRTTRLVVDADPHDEDGCVNCVGAIDYTATVAYDHDLPDHVELAHRSRSGETRVVTGRSRNDDV